VRDHLYVSAVFLDDGRSRAAIVTVDAGGLGDDVVKAAIAQSSAATGCPPENYIISATHTHSGRSGANVTQITTAAIVQAVNEARAKLAPASRLPCPSPSSNHASSPITVRRGPQLRRGMKSLSEHHRSPPQDLGRRLRLRRLQLGLTQKQAGLCVGASPASFRSWELGRKPGRGHLPALLVFLGSRSGSGRRA
jgi:DNA-binding XRE family transcriptional regulator